MAEHCAGDRRCLASTSHDETLRLWDLAMLHDEGDGEEGAEGEEEENAEAGEQVALLDTLPVAAIAGTASQRACKTSLPCTCKPASWYDCAVGVLFMRMCPASVQMPAAAAADADSDSEEKPQPKAKRRRKEKRKGGKVVQKQSHRDAAFFADLV